MYGMKMGGKAKETKSAGKKTDTFKDANSAVKGAKKRGEPSVTFMLAVGKPKMPMPMRGQRTATNMMKKSSRGK